MKKLAFVGRSIQDAVLLIVLCLGVSVWLAQAQESSTRTDITELLKAHDEALNQHHLDALLALYAPSPKTVMLGTGPGEKFQGAEELKAAIKDAKTTALLVKRNDTRIFVPVELG